MTAPLDKCYSLDGEEFNSTSIGELIDLHHNPQVGGVYWEAHCSPLQPTDGINNHTVDSLLENMDELIYEQVGEIYDSEFSHVTDEARVELRGLIKSWAIKHIDLYRYWKIVGETRECKFTAEDLE